MSEETLYAMDDAVVMFPHERAATASKAKYLGWQELEAVGMVETPFDPRFTTAHVRWMFRHTDSPFAELTHKYGDAMTPGAYKCWVVEIDPSWA
jgi:hypothetical protein